MSVTGSTCKLEAGGHYAPASRLEETKKNEFVFPVNYYTWPASDARRQRGAGTDVSKSVMKADSRSFSWAIRH